MQMHRFESDSETGLVHHAAYPSREAAKRDLSACIDTYGNRQRRHSALGYLNLRTDRASGRTIRSPLPRVGRLCIAALEMGDS